MSIELIKTLSQTMDDSTLVDAIDVLVRARREREEAQLAEMKFTLVKGDIVEFYHPAQKKYIRASVKKVKKKKALVVDESTNMTWDVPMGMLKKVGSDND